MKTCNWCDNEAKWTTAKHGNACNAHKRELERCVEAGAHSSGNRWTGEAADAAVRPI